MERYKKFCEATNNSVIETFCLDFKPNIKLRTMNLNIIPVEDKFILVNYAVGLAMRIYEKNVEGWKIILNTKKYSSTTSKIQNMVKKICADAMVELEEVDYMDFFNMAEK